MELNMEKVSLKDMTHKQFRKWLLPIVEHTLFVDRERILKLLTMDTDRDTLTEAFREFFEAYYYDVAFALDRHLLVFNKLERLCEICDDYPHKALKGVHRGKFSLSVAKDYRVIYTFDRRIREIVVHRVGHRSSIY